VQTQIVKRWDQAADFVMPRKRWIGEYNLGVTQP
jgi:hypothetical protein